VAEVGAWKYAFRYEITARHMPELPEQARPIGEAQARRKLVELTLASLGATQTRDLVKLFGWLPDLAQRTVAGLAQNGKLIEHVEHPKSGGEWVALPELVE
jgi:uncharacterized protein YcaQ